MLGVTTFKAMVTEYGQKHKLVLAVLTMLGRTGVGCECCKWLDMATFKVPLKKLFPTVSLAVLFPILFQMMLLHTELVVGFGSRHPQDHRGKGGREHELVALSLTAISARIQDNHEELETGAHYSAAISEELVRNTLGENERIFSRTS